MLALENGTIREDMRRAPSFAMLMYFIWINLFLNKA